MTESWWVGLDRAQFAVQAQTEAVRMLHDKKARHYSTNPHQFSQPARRAQTPYTYAVEQERLEATA